MTPQHLLELVRQKRGIFDAALIMAFCQVESSFNEGAFLADRNGGSYGLMQLDYPTARDRGYRGAPQGLFDPATNVTYGVAQLGWLWGELKKRGMASRDNLAAAYNEGLGNVERGVPDPLYVQKIENARITWRQALGEGP